MLAAGTASLSLHDASQTMLGRDLHPATLSFESCLSRRDLPSRPQLEQLLLLPLPLPLQRHQRLLFHLPYHLTEQSPIVLASCNDWLPLSGSA